MENKMKNNDLNKKFLDLLKERLSYSFQLSDSLDLKATTILGFCGIILTLMLSLIFLSNETSIFFKKIFFIGMVFIFFGILFMFKSIKSKPFWQTPSISKIDKDQDDFEKIIKSAVEGKPEKLIKSYKNNMKLNKKKSRDIDKGIYLIILGLLINLFVVFLYIF